MLKNINDYGRFTLKSVQTYMEIQVSPLSKKRICTLGVIKCALRLQLKVVILQQFFFLLSSCESDITSNGTPEGATPWCLYLLLVMMTIFFCTLEVCCYLLLLNLLMMRSGSRLWQKEMIPVSDILILTSKWRLFPCSTCLVKWSNHITCFIEYCSCYTVSCETLIDIQIIINIAVSMDLWNSEVIYQRII